MKKTYETPTLEAVKLNVTDILVQSKTEDVGGGGDWGGNGEFGDDFNW